MSLPRRRFLAASAALPAAALLPDLVPPATAQTGTKPSFDPWVEVNPAHLAHNVGEIRRRAGGRPILAVIKNNGYGLGLLNVARLLEPEAGVSGFAVVKLQEALLLRDGGIRKPILLMGPVADAELFEVVRRDVMPMVYTDVGGALDAAAARLQRTIPLHVCVDTGIGRVGVPFHEAEPLIRALAAHRSVRVGGIMTTFTEDAEFDREQLRRFTGLCGRLRDQGIEIGARHAASSFGLFRNPAAFLDMVRPGMVIYGAYPEPEFRGTVMDLRPAVSLKARVIYVKQLRPGDGAGYNRAYVAKQPVWVATLPVGHADGLPRMAVKGGRVRIGARLYPLIGAISASHSIVEIGAERSVAVGDEVAFFDDCEGSRPEDLGAACGASVYDLTMHLNPLLPRVVGGQVSHCCILRDLAPLPTSARSTVQRFTPR